MARDSQNLSPELMSVDQVDDDRSREDPDEVDAFSMGLASMQSPAQARSLPMPAMQASVAFGGRSAKKAAKMEFRSSRDEDSDDRLLDSAGQDLENTNREVLLSASRSYARRAQPRQAGNVGFSSHSNEPPDVTKVLLERYFWAQSAEAERTANISPNRRDEVSWREYPCPSCESRFWRDFANHMKCAASSGSKKFLSPNLILATSSVTEALLSLAFTELPFSSSTDMKKEDNELVIQSPSRILLFKSAIDECSEGKKSQVFAVQTLFDPSDRNYRRSNEVENSLDPSSGMIHSHEPVGCKVVIVNGSPTPRNIATLVQIPQGAIPLMGDHSPFYTRVFRDTLEAHNIVEFSYRFYFPRPGSYRMYPAHVADSGEGLICHAATLGEIVVSDSESPSEAVDIDKASWTWVAKHASDEECIAALSQRNPRELNLAAIEARCSNESFFKAVTEKLREKGYYSRPIWRYSLAHKSPEQLREFLAHEDYLITRLCGVASYEPLECRPLDVFSSISGEYRHYEFDPLVVARAHQFAGRKRIFNDRLRLQYSKLLNTLARLSPDALGEPECLSLAYYLLLQDRIKDAKCVLERKTDSHDQGLESGFTLQRDYLNVYMALALDPDEEERKNIREICAKYVGNDSSLKGLKRWTDRFAKVVEALNEAEDLSDENAVASSVDSREPFLRVQVKDDCNLLIIEGQGFSRCEVGFHVLDLELLFSNKPFFVASLSTAASSSLDFIFTQAKDVQSIELSPVSKDGPSKAELQVPKARAQLVQVTAHLPSSTWQLKSTTLKQVVFINSNDLHVSRIGDSEELKVVNSQTMKPVSAAYVKVYGSHHGGAREAFYKDGYTDIRGRFNFKALSSSDKNTVQKFAVLVSTAKNGSSVVLFT